MIDYSKATFDEISKAIIDILNDCGRTDGFCGGVSCSKCLFNRLKTEGKSCSAYLLLHPKETINAIQDYVFKEDRPDWKSLKVDEEVLVSNYGERWKKAHFAKYENGKVFVWCGGRTSFTAINNETVSYGYAKLPEKIKEDD